VVETSLNAPSSEDVPLTTSSPPAAPDAGRVARAAPEEVALPTLASKASRKGKGKGKVSV